VVVARINQGAVKSERVRIIFAQPYRDREKMTSLLSKIYTNPRNPGSFAGIDTLYKEAKKQNTRVTRRMVEHFLEGQRTYGLFKQRRLTFPRSKTYASGYYTDAQADLAGFFLCL
jgi:hypothetical protein